jgi:hypothetical protein
VQQYIEYMFITAVVIVFNQFYAYAVSLTGQEKQSTCQRLGIAYITLGILSFVIRTPPVVIAGFILIMMGLRLIAHGLDRIDKNIFIDRYDSDK